MKYKINDIEFNVEVNSYCSNKAEVTVNGVTYQVEICSEAPVHAAPQAAVVDMPAASVSVNSASKPESFGQSATGKPVNSPLPGVILAVKVNVGDSVKAGQVVAILEAMKMENEIQAEFDGIVTSVNVSPEDSILEGAPIITIGM
jgi:biotin carboxyl carrier protein